MGCTPSQPETHAPRTPGKAASPPPPPGTSPPLDLATPDEKTPACNEYRVDVTASGFGICVCGRPQSEHSAASRSKKRQSGSKRSIGEGWIDPTSEGDPRACDDFRVDIEHETFGMCKCGSQRAAHSSTAVRGRSENMRSPVRTKKVLDKEYIDQKACSNFVRDVESPIEDMCACGIIRKHHMASARTPPKTRRRSNSSGGRVTDLVKKHESLIQDSAQEAWQRLQEQDALARETDASKAAERLRRRRSSWLAKIERARKDGQCVAPRFANVAADSKELVIEVTSETPGALLYWCHAKPGQDATRAFAAAEGDRSSPTAGLRRHDPARDGVLRVRGHEPGTHVIVARALKKGLLDSELASGGFRLEPPSFLFTSAHAHELRSLHLPSGSSKNLDGAFAELGCSVCASKLAAGEGFTCQTCGFNLCLRCALPHRHADDAPPGSPGRLKPPPPPIEASVAVDVGARRLWLSDNIRFVGNAAEILEESLPLLDALGKALKAHPGVAVRLEGHTNSKCGQECNGRVKCSNSACHKNFGTTGGAAGFSLARANAVRDMLVKRKKIDKNRIETRGLAGSRRLASDTEGAEKHRNRRVEVHTVAF